MQNGWIKLHRKILEKGYYKKSAYIHLWVHLLLSANHKGQEYMQNGEIIYIKEGQILTGRKQLSKDTGIPETTIERVLEMLEKEGQIGQQKTTKYRLITIVNWKTHQDADSKRTANGQQTDTNKNVRMKERIQAEASSAEIPLLIECFVVINPACKRMYGNTTQRKACQSLIDTYGFDRVKGVIEKTLPKTNAIEYMPTITTPLQLFDRWSSLEAAIKKYQGKSASENKKKGHVYL